MTRGIPAAVAAAAAGARRELSGLVLAATLRTVRDLDIAEEATADAFLLALQAWTQSGIPDSVQAWLITAARRRAIDRVRRAQADRRALMRESGGWSGVVAGTDDVAEAAVVGDDELRLVVLCCDPRLGADDQVALTLRLACGVPTASIAAAFLVSTSTMAARITRAKGRLAKAGPALDLPDDETVNARLPAVRRVVYLAFTLGHTAGSGPELRDEDLCDHAQYLAGVLRALRPDDPEFTALLALILLTRARGPGRLDDDGGQVLLADADRSRWDRALINRGRALVAATFVAVRQAGGEPGPLALQAAIAAEHAAAPRFTDTAWDRVVALYDALLETEPGPTLALGRCVAVSYRYGPELGLADLDGVMALGGLDGYPYGHAARAQMLERLDRAEEAARAWQDAAGRARTDAERDFFLTRSAGAEIPGKRFTPSP